GNAAFHSDILYSRLSHAVPYLCSGLRDGDEKTRANAAGALGNFARNSSVLCASLCAEKCPQQLLMMAVRDPSVFTKRIALFSVGTLAAYSSC
ncbi:TIO, partial [Symbiodinium microadriaticum]